MINNRADALKTDVNLLNVLAFFVQILKPALITGLHLSSACVSFLFFLCGSTSRTTIPSLMMSCTLAGHQFYVPWSLAGIDMITAVDQYQTSRYCSLCVLQYHPTSGLVQILNFNWLRYSRTINSPRVAIFTGFENLSKQWRLLRVLWTFQMSF